MSGTSTEREFDGNRRDVERLLFGSEAAVPSHVVVFREQAAASRRTVLARYRRAIDLPSSGLDQLEVFEPRRAHGAYSHYYPKLRVLYCDLAPPEAEEVALLPGVAAVGVNTLRRMGWTLRRGVNRVLRGGRPSYSWGLESVRVHQQSRGLTGAGIRVAVLDTGIDDAHPDLQGRVLDSRPYVGNSVADDHGHGTACAGIIAARADTQHGIRYSVAPDCELLVAKVLNDQGYGYEHNITAAMTWASKHGARIISVSIQQKPTHEPFHAGMEATCAALRRRGCLVIFAAGNGPIRAILPEPLSAYAACPSVFSVGAIDRHDKVARFSARPFDGKGTLSACAPGVDVEYPTPGGGYESDSGTSLAAPHAAGVAALFLQRDPTLTPDALADAMKMRSRPIGAAIEHGKGALQAPA